MKFACAKFTIGYAKAYKKKLSKHEQRLQAWSKPMWCTLNLKIDQFHQEIKKETVYGI